MPNNPATIHTYLKAVARALILCHIKRSPGSNVVYSCSIFSEQLVPSDGDSTDIGK